MEKEKTLPPCQRLALYAAILISCLIAWVKFPLVTVAWIMVCLLFIGAIHLAKKLTKTW